MELTRRDALTALAASGITVGAGSALTWDALRDDTGPSKNTDERMESSDAEAEESVAFTEPERETLSALARTLYPEAVTGVPEFVETYVVGRVRDRPAYAGGMKAALATLNDYASEWFDGRYGELSLADREALLRQMGLDTAAPDPAGSDPERLRYYLLNELLYALYSTPIGGKLVGIRNPPGHPGGTASYKRGPSRG
jgi:hypothetical protein